MHLNLFKKLIQETAQATGDLIGNKNTNSIAKVTKSEKIKINMIKKYLKKYIHISRKNTEND